MPQCLIKRCGNDIEAREQEAEADCPQGDCADFQHLFRCVENAQKLRRKELERQKAQRHDCRCVKHTQLNCPHNALRIACAVVVCHDWHHAVIQTEHRHENKALQLEIHAEYCCRRRGKGNQYFVHAEGHDRTNRRHTDGRDADGINLFDCHTGKSVFFWRYYDIVVFLFVVP